VNTKAITPDVFPERNTSFSDIVVRCPRCHGPQLHHGMVRIFTRRSHEDAPSHIVTVNADGTVHMEPPTSDCHLPRTQKNPSSRRDGLRIEFFCEDCGGGLFLEISQHKGSTNVEWFVTTNW
jgi:hypothetical protein